MSAQKLNQYADSGFKDASNYDAHRPAYPDTAVTKFLTALNLVPDAAPNARIVEIAAGTGKFTRSLVERDEAFQIVAVEPHVEMRQSLEDNVKGKWKGGVKGSVDVRAGSAEAMEVGENWGDCAIAAQSFHWFANETALKEIHRVLRPGAAFGMIWNVEYYNSPKSWTPPTQWEQKLKDIIWSLDDGQPRFRNEKWKEAFENQMGKASNPLQTIKSTLLGDFSYFSLPLGEDEESWSVWLSEKALWDRFATLSQIAVLKGEELESVKSRFSDAVSSPDAKRNSDGQLEVHGRTYWAWTSRV